MTLGQAKPLYRAGGEWATIGGGHGPYPGPSPLILYSSGARTWARPVPGTLPPVRSDARLPDPRTDMKAAAKHHPGKTREDPYAWLKDGNWAQVMREPSRLEPRIRSWLEAQNEATARAMAGTEALQERLFSELRGRIKEDDRSVPLPDGPHEYYHRYRHGGQHPLYCRRPRGGGAGEEVLLDGDEEAEGSEYFKVGAFVHSPDHRHAAYSVDRNGSEIYTLRIRDLRAGRDLPDSLSDAAGPVVWANDGLHLFYPVLDAHHRPVKVLRHRLGTAAAEDALVYEEADPGFFIGVGTTSSRRFVIVDAHDHTTSELRLIDADHPDEAARLVAERERDVEYHVDHHRDRLLILTNADGAEDFKIVEAPLARPQRRHWKDLIPHRPGRLILDLAVYRDHAVRMEREDALPRLVVTDLAGGAEHAVAIEEEVFDLALLHGHEFDTRSIHYSSSTPAVPARTWRYDLGTRERRLVKEQEVPSGHDPAAYVARRLSAESDDGEGVPITVLHRRETPIDGSAPLLLYGYGSYGISIPASFRITPLSLVERGFVYAVAHVRGGKERGYRWYRDGKLDRKTNTFRDFIAAAEHLAAQGYARRGGIACHGGSAGGLLVGAAINLRPELFRAAVAEVPFVDVLNTMCDDTLPLTPPEWPEWGNPIADPDACRYIASYSPYDNIETKDYPHILATAGLSDPRVGYWEPAKWVARLAATRTDDHLLLLKTHMGAGHGGAAGRFERLKENAFAYAFVLLAFGLAESGAPPSDREP